jgi:phosphomevalonate kinase
MLIAQQKQKENIAEYILYMYQIEDVIRAYKFDIEAIMEQYVGPHIPNASFTESYRRWYGGLIQDMQEQRLEKSGHLIDLKEILVEISYLHNTLINLQGDHKYQGVFERALPMIEEFKERSNLKDKNHIEIAFHAMYMKLLMKLQKKEISAETEEAFDAMRVMLAYLSKSYAQMKAGDMDFLNN